nr:hypothetical protein [Tanacetum cinerariifolium]
MVDFVEASPLRYALTFKPTVYVSHIRHFWSTARIEATEEGTKILATIDGILRIVTKSYLRRNLKLQDEEGIREACHTDSGFIADQDRATIAKSSTLPHDSAPRVTSHAADEGREDLDEGEATAERVSDDTEEMATVLTSMDASTILASRVAEVPTSSGLIPTASPPAAEVPTGSDVVPTASPVFAIVTVVTSYRRRKGKEVMVESETLKKQKVQEQIDAQGMSFEEIEARFTTVWKQLEDFIPMGSKEEAERLKRKGLSLEQESVKKSKTSEEVTEEAKSPDEVSEEKVYTKGQRSYWKITRLRGNSASYQFFIDLLKHLDREDLNHLWALVKESLSNRPPTSDKEMELWVELKRLYEHDDEDQLWTHTQNFMHAPVEWKLYDICEVHQVTSKDKEIFMLVEKDYPLRKAKEVDKIQEVFQTLRKTNETANELWKKFNDFIPYCPEYHGYEKLKVKRFQRMLRSDIQEVISLFKCATLYDLLSRFWVREMDLLRKKNKEAKGTKRKLKFRDQDTKNLKHDHGRRDCKKPMILCFSCKQLGYKSNEFPNPKAIETKPLKSIKEKKVGVLNPKSRVYVMAVEEDKLVHDVVTCTILFNSIPAHVLYDSNTSVSFVSYEFSKNISTSPNKLSFPLEVEIANSKDVVVSNVYRDVEIEIYDSIFMIDLIPNMLRIFDIVIGMDWLDNYNATILCSQKLVWAVNP